MNLAYSIVITASTFLFIAYLGWFLYRVFQLDLLVIGNLTIKSVFKKMLRHGVLLVCSLLGLMSPFFLEIIPPGGVVVFKDGRLVRTMEERRIMWQTTWDNINAESRTFRIRSGEVERHNIAIPFDGDNTILRVEIDGTNEYTNVIYRLGYLATNNIDVNLFQSHAGAIVDEYVRTSPYYDDLKRLSKSNDVSGDRSKPPIRQFGRDDRVRIKKEFFDILDRLSDEIWIKFKIRIVDAQF